MPTEIPAGFKLGILEPKDAIAAFEQRKLLQPSFRWQDVWQEEHSRAFAVAGVQRLDVLQIFQDQIGDVLKNGGTLADFKKAIRPQLAAKGWWGDVEITDAESGEIRTTRFDDRRLQLIYDTNLRQSYAAGRWRQVEANKRLQPYIVYKTMDDARVRPAHRAWHNLVLPVDNPFWSTHWPPNGWRCRCHAYAISKRQLDRMVARGDDLKFDAPPEQVVPFVNHDTGEIKPVPRGVDPGFGYNPGKGRDAELHDALLHKAIDSAALPAAVVMAQAQADYAGLVEQTTEAFGPWVDGVLKQGQPVGEMKHIGVIQPAVIRALAQRDAGPQGAVISVTDADALHALRAGKGTAIDLSIYRRLPELLARASAVLRELTSDPQVLLYVVDLQAEDGSVAKLVVQLDQTRKVRLEGKRRTVILNTVRTASVMDPQALEDRVTYELLWGRL